MRKIIRKIHTYLAIPIGIFIFILCITGMILVFQTEIKQMLNPNFYTLSKSTIEGKEPIALEKLIPILNTQLKDNEVTGVTIYDDPIATYRVSLKEGFRETAFVDQYNGKVLGQETASNSFFMKVMSIHRWLMDSTRSWGKFITSWSTVAFVIILITGFFYLKKKYKGNYKVVTSKGSKRLIFDLHNALGNYAFILLLILSLTGLMWSFTPYRNAVFYIFGDRTPTTENTDHGKGGRGKGGKGERAEQKLKVNYAMWDIALENFKVHADQYDFVKVVENSITAHPKNTYRPRVTDEYGYNPKTGELTTTTLFESRPIGNRVMMWAYSLHVGDYWGIWSKIITCIATLIGASLPVTGYYLWLRKKKRKK